MKKVSIEGVDGIMMPDSYESIIISTDHKNALIASVLLFIILRAIKGFVIGYWLGKRCN